MRQVVVGGDDRRIQLSPDRSDQRIAVMTGFAFLIGGVFQFIEIANRRRTRAIG